MFSYIKKFFNTNISFLIILIIVVFSLYGKAINYELTNLDDTILIKDNITYISNIKNIPDFFTTSCFYSKDCSYYRPILTLSFAIETILFGYNIKVYHITNILLYILSFYLMFVLLLKLKLNKNISKFILLLFAVHPILLSLPIWIPARNDTLITVFTLLFFINIVLFYNNNFDKYKVFYYLFFLLALFTKENAIILIPVYFLFIYTFQFKIKKRQILKDILIFLFIFLLYITLRNISISNISVLSIIANYKLILKNIINGLFIFTEKLIFTEHIPILLYSIKLTTSTIIINLLTIFLLIFIYIKKTISAKKFIFSFLWYLLFLLPTFFIFEEQIFFHRLLLPLFGIIFFISSLIEQILIRYKFLKKYFIFVAIILFCTFFYSSSVQIFKYKDNKYFTINTYLDSHNRISDYAFIDLLINTGHFEDAKNLLLKKMKERTTYREILVLAKLYLASGHFEEAEYAYLQLEKDLPVQKELVFVPLSEIYYIKEDYQKAFDYIQKAYELKPYDTNTLKQLAKVDEKIGNIEQALDIYKNLSKIEKSNKEYKDKISLLEKEIKKID